MRDLIRLSIVLALALVFANPLTPASAADTPWTAYTPQAGNLFYSPQAYFEDMRKEYPEMEAINPEKFPFLQAAIAHMISAGVPILAGIEPNYEEKYDLYMSTVARSNAHPNTQMGPDLNSDVGKLYFNEHDIFHHLAGIPGLRMSDLSDPKALEKFTRIIFKKEVFASAQTSMLYIPAYWEWREKPSPEIIDEFRQYNQGFYSTFNPLTPAEHVNLVESFVFGRTWQYLKAIWNGTDTKSIGRAKDLGVPRLAPSLDRYVGRRLDNILISVGSLVVEPIRGYFARVAYKGFSEYTANLAKLVFQPWYVQWSDDFKVGIPLDQLEKRTDNLIDQLRSGATTLVDPDGAPQNLDWNRSFFNTELSLFGRRLAEVREVMKAAAQSEKLSAHYQTDLSELNEFYADAVQLHGTLANGADLAAVKEQFLSLVSKVETELPVDRVIPFSHRLTGVSYVQFWRNPYAFAMSRGNLPSTRFAPSLLESKKDVATELPTAEVLKTEIGQRKALQDGLIRQYRFEQNARIVPVGAIEGLPAFAAKLDLLVRNNFLKSLPSFTQLKQADREQIESICLQFLKQSAAELKTCSVSTVNGCSDFTRINQFLVELRSLASDLKAGEKLDKKALVRLANPPAANQGSAFTYFFQNGKIVFDAEMIDLVHPALTAEGKVVTAKIQPYTAMSEWIDHHKIMGCRELLDGVKL
jgi:hypothetical protein